MFVFFASFFFLLFLLFLEARRFWQVNRRRTSWCLYCYASKNLETKDDNNRFTCLSAFFGFSRLSSVFGCVTSTLSLITLIKRTIQLYLYTHQKKQKHREKRGFLRDLLWKNELIGNRNYFSKDRFLSRSFRENTERFNAHFLYRSFSGLLLIFNKIYLIHHWFVSGFDLYLTFFYTREREEDPSRKCHR